MSAHVRPDVTGGLAASDATMDAPPNRWQLRYEQNPNIIWENGIAYDPRTRRVVFHGGHVGRLYPQSTYTFLYDLVHNRFYESQAPCRPQRRCLISFDYIDSCQRFITCHGGASHGSMLLGELLGGDYTRLMRKDQVGPWLYDSVADTWEDCRTLPPRWQRRAHTAIAYDYVSDVVWSLGKTELMAFIPRTNRVIFRRLPDELKGRTAYGLAADAVRRKLVIFGGNAPGGPENAGLTREQIYNKLIRDDTWVYDIVADTWRQSRPETRPPRGWPGHSMLSLQMAYHHPSGRAVLLQNGIDRYEPDTSKWPPSQLWSFDFETEQWAKLETKNPPPFMGLLEYAPEEDLLIVFGGGRDGIDDDGKRISPALSRQIWTCRLVVPGRLAGPAVLDRILIETGRKQARLVLPRAAASRASHCLHRAEVGPDGVPGRYEQITKSGAPSFADSKLQPGKVYAYYMAGDDGVPSLPVFTQPFRPGGLRASVESARKVVLCWRSNSENDIVGYKVFRADGKELDTGQGRLLTERPLAATTFVDETVDLSDKLIRSYWVTAVNAFGVESGASPLAHTVPDAPEGFTFLEGIAPSNGVGVKERWLISWRWPADRKIAGFNVYHAVEHIDTLLHPGGWDAYWKLWQKLNDQPIAGTEFVFEIPKAGPPEHYFYVRPVNVLGQEGFATDIISPTDRRFRP